MSSQSALKKYQELICNFQKRNRELLYKGSPQSISLTAITTPKDCPDPHKVRNSFQPGKLSNQNFVDSINSGKLNLDEHFIMKIENPTLRRRINALRNADDNYQKEFGISGAWFVGPFILWRTKDMTSEVDDIFLSPLIKNPIDVRKNKSKQDVIELEEAGIHHINPTLRILLKKEYGVSLEKEYSGTIQEVLEQICNALRNTKIDVSLDLDCNDIFKIPAKSKTIEDENGEKTRVQIPLEERYASIELEKLKSITTSHFVIQDAFYIDVFDASKMSLYYDYEEIIEKSPKEESKLISSLVNEGVYLDEINSNKFSSENENFYVVEIDGSQHNAIKKCQLNEGFVIQGPPGTGKSQTITNLISQLLAQGKKVLFVAEKRAALDVVYSRLSSTGLGKHSVILHDNEVNKNALYKSYVEAFKEKGDETVGEKWGDIASALDMQSKNVSEYFRQLHEKPAYAGTTNYEFLSMYAIAPKEELKSNLYQKLSHLDWMTFSKTKEITEETQRLYDSFSRYESSHWRFYTGHEHFDDMKVDLFIRTKKEISEQTAINANAQEQLSNLFPNGSHTVISECTFEIPQISDFEVAALMINNYINGSNSKMVLLEIKDRIRTLKSKVSSFKLVKENASRASVELLKEYFSKPKSFMKFFSIKYWKMKSLAKEVLVDTSYTEMGNIYNDWLVFNQFDIDVSSALDYVYKSIRVSSSDKDFQLNELDQHLSFANYILRIRSEVGGSRFFEEFNSLSLKKLLQDLTYSIPISKRLVTSKDNILKLKQVISSHFHEAHIDRVSDFPAFIDEVLNSRADLVQVQLITDHLKTMEKTLRVSDVFSIVGPLSAANKKWWDVFSFHVLSVIRDRIFSDYAQIRLFSSTKVESEILKLNGLFDTHKSFSKSAVDFQVSKARANTLVPNKIAKMIENEANKTRRIKSPREVMESGALEVMLEWKRCWLMSPLSISQILPNQPDLFDVVIFDEASQVKLEDAIPSIYRGKTLIVVGDNKQMPPTNFFGGGYDDDDLDEFELAESLLDQAAKKYPSVMLEWHYRSEAESLIAFSNFAYYEGRLIVPPNPGTLCSSKAVEFISIEDGVFESKNGNEVEASRIVKDVRDILINNPKASVGIISMGMSQQKAISKVIEQLCESDPKFEAALSFSLSYFEDGSYKGFFNRNLENVQGDERDFIFLSVGYGKNKLGKFRKAFGPLSIDGGGRRLNVAVTRARKKMTIYCSFEPSLLGSDEASFSSNPNTATFARFLQYSKFVSENNEKSALSILNSFKVNQSFESRNDVFRTHVANALSNLGLIVRENVGNCGFVIDIGIFSNSNPDEFVLGIDINKGVSSSDKFLRDLFKNRLGLLDKRGWNIYSLWVQDWILKPQESMDQILKIVKERSKKVA